MRILLLCVLAFALAGCTDSGGGTEAPTMTSSSSTTATGPPPKPVVTSDTLHLMTPPDMLLALPQGSTEISTPATTGFSGGPGGGGGQDEQGAAWSYVVTAPSNVTAAEAKVWIEITETLIQSPFTGNPTQPSCTWILVLELGADGEAEVGCLSEPPGPINPGVKELTFSFAALGAEMEVNETINLEFHRTAFSASANNAVFVLSGSVDHDSRVKLTGFKDPVPDA